MEFRQHLTSSRVGLGLVYDASTDTFVLDLISPSPSSPSSSSSSSSSCRSPTCMAPTTPTPTSSPGSSHELCSYHDSPPPSSSSSSPSSSMLPSPASSTGSRRSSSSSSSSKKVVQLVYHLVMCHGGENGHGKLWHMVKACFKSKKTSSKKKNKVKGCHNRNESAQLREQDLKEAIDYCKASWISSQPN